MTTMLLFNYVGSFGEHKKIMIYPKKYFDRKGEYSVALNQRNVGWLHVLIKL